MRKEEILYSVTVEDVFGVAKDKGISTTKITPEVIQRVKKFYENGFEWYETTEQALDYIFDYKV